jgi:multidrug efflux pump subunit AcrA (membrane-fusion protein)
MGACTVPLVSAARIVGALVFERGGAAVPSPREIELCEHIACLLGPVVELKHHAGRSWGARAAETVRVGWAKLTGRGDPWPKVVSASLIAAAAAAVMIPVQYRIGAPARLEGAEQRVVAAPMDGYLRQAHARPGDVVRAGDPLIELADQDLVLEGRKWESALAQHENGYTAALTRADRTQFVISQAKATEARAQLDLVRQQLGRTRLTAPIDGVVIKGDLSQSLGAPVQRGEPLMTISIGSSSTSTSVTSATSAPDSPGTWRCPRFPWKRLHSRSSASPPWRRSRTGAMRSRSKPGSSPVRRRCDPDCRVWRRSTPAPGRSPGSGPIASSTGCA